MRMSFFMDLGRTCIGTLKPRGPADASRLLSVSEAKVGSVDIEDTSLADDDDDGR